MADMTYAEGLAASLPVRDDEANSDLISLADIVVTGCETPWHHFGLREYDWDADGVQKPWGRLVGLKSATTAARPHHEEVVLTASVVRNAVRRYLQSRLEAGMDPKEAAHLIDGSYTDAVIADSILQFAIYGEEVFG